MSPMTESRRKDPSQNLDDRRGTLGDRRTRPRLTTARAFWPIVRLLQDGKPVVLRPIVPADRFRLQQALDELSAASRRARFFADVERLTDDQLTYLTRVDQERHVAWIATDPARRGRAVGVGRFIRLEDEPDVAELALTVVDACQERGLGTSLLGLLYHRATLIGLRSLRVFTTPANDRFARRLRRLGGVSAFQDGALRIELPIHRAPDALPRNPVAERLRRLLREYEAAFGSPIRRPDRRLVA
jgi:GNAT superfamily N-acetyltransferase